jgi:transposase
MGIFVACSLPTDFGWRTPYWTSGRVRYLIDFFFNVFVSHSYVKRLLRELGLSYKKSEVRNIRRNEYLVRKWREHAAPRIQAFVEDPETAVFFMDECTVCSDVLNGRSWSLIGEPNVLLQSMPYKTGCLGAVSPSGEAQAMTIQGSVNSSVVIEFFKMLRDVTKEAQLVIVLDNASWHRSQEVFEWIRSTPGVELIFLPPYTPEFNPVELMWSQLKRTSSAELPRQTESQFLEAVNNDLAEICMNTDLVQAFFKKESVKYALGA